MYRYKYLYIHTYWGGEEKVEVRMKKIRQNGCELEK